MDKIIKFLKRNLLEIIGVATGVLGGYLYWHFIGCTSGSCPITSSPTMSMVWGGAVGGLLFSIFKGKKKTTN